MKRDMKTMLAVITMLVAATAVAQQANTLDTYKQSYEKQEQAILAQYGKALDTVMADLKQKGDLDGVAIDKLLITADPKYDPKEP